MLEPYLEKFVLAPSGNRILLPYKEYYMHISSSTEQKKKFQGSRRFLLVEKLNRAANKIAGSMKLVGAKLMIEKTGRGKLMRKNRSAKLENCKGTACKNNPT